MARALALVVLVVLVTARHAASQTITWVGGGTAGSWVDVNNWNPARLPNASDDVAIPGGTPSVFVPNGTHAVRSITAGRQIRVTGGSLTVAEASSLTGFVVTAGTLALNGATTSAATTQITGGLLTGAGDITCNFNMSWTGGEIAGTGTLTLAAGTATFTGPMAASYELVIRRNLVIQTTCNFTMGTLTLRDGTDVTLGAGGTLNFGTDPFVGNIIRAIEAGSMFACHGRINQTSTANMLTSISVPMQTSATARISVTGMSLGLVLVGEQFGDFEVATGKSIGLSGGPTAIFQAGSSVFGGGRPSLSDVEFTSGTFLSTGGFGVNAGTVIIRDPVVGQGVLASGGTLEIHGAHRYSTFSNGFASSAVVRIMDSLALTGTNTLGGGRFEGPGTLTFEAGSTTVHDGNSTPSYGCTTQNFGTIEPRASGFVVLGGATFTNRAGGTIRLQSGSISSVTTPGTFVNEGLVTSSFPGVRSITGLVNMASGVIETVGQGSLALVIPALPPTQGRLTAFADVSISGPSPAVDLTINGGLHLAAGGRFSLSRGNFSFAPGFAPVANELSVGACTLFLDGDLPSIPTIVVGSNGVLNVRAPSTIRGVRMTGTNPTGTITGPGDLTVMTVAQLDGEIGGAGRLILAPACDTTTTATGTRNWTRLIENHGRMTIGGTITLGDSAFSNAGTLTFDTASNRNILLNGGNAALLRNTGTLTTVTTTGTGAANINCRVDQLGTAHATSTSLNFNSVVNQASGERLSGGRWVTSGTGILRLPAGVVARVIGPGASVVLGGADNSLPWLSNTLRGVDGELELRGWRTLTLTPPSPAGFVNSGRVALGADSTLNILGAYTQAAAGVLAVDYDEPPLDPRLRAWAFQLDGRLTASFVNGFMIDAGVPLHLLGTGPIAGRFSASSAPQSRRVVYSATTPDLRFVCVADVDNGSGTGTPDGGVTIDDLLYYLAMYSEGVPDADVDDGSGAGMPDGGVTIDDLLYYLVRYDLGC